MSKKEDKEYLITKEKFKRFFELEDKFLNRIEDMEKEEIEELHNLEDELNINEDLDSFLDEF